MFSMQIKYSIMHPGTHVWPHTGPTNCRLRMHLGLVIPKEGCKIRCANETKYVSSVIHHIHHLWGWEFVTTELCSFGLLVFFCSWSRLEQSDINPNSWVYTLSCCFLLAWRHCPALGLPSSIISQQSTYLVEELPCFSLWVDRCAFRVSQHALSPADVMHCVSCIVSWLIHEYKKSP